MTEVGVDVVEDGDVGDGEYGGVGIEARRVIAGRRGYEEPDDVDDERVGGSTDGTSGDRSDPVRFRDDHRVKCSPVLARRTGFDVGSSDSINTFSD